MSRYELLGLIGATIALLILLAVLLRRRASRRKLSRPQDSRAARGETAPRLPAPVEEPWQPAQLRVELVGATDERRFVFSNAGPGVARNVSFAFADAGGWSPPVILAQFREVFPIQEFRPNQQRSCIAALHLAHPAVLTGVFTWEDENGVSRQTTCRIPS